MLMSWLSQLFSTYRDTAVSSLSERDVPNCELSDRDSRELDVHDPSLFDTANYDFYERSLNQGDGECMDGMLSNYQKNPV